MENPPESTTFGRLQQVAVQTIQNKAQQKSAKPVDFENLRNPIRIKGAEVHARLQIPPANLRTAVYPGTLWEPSAIRVDHN
jgi:hypothetical protein